MTDEAHPATYRLLQITRGKRRIVLETDDLQRASQFMLALSTVDDRFEIIDREDRVMSEANIQDTTSQGAEQKSAFAYTVTAWGPERPEMAFPVDTAAQAYALVLDKAVYASLQVRVANSAGEEITLDELCKLAEVEATR